MAGKDSDTAGRPYGTAIVKATAILKYLGSVQHGAGVSEIARELRMNRATVFKILETLQDLELVVKDEKAATYRLGIGLAKLALSALGEMDLVSVARPFLEHLNRETGETIHLGIINDNQVVYVDKLESTQSIRMYSQIGKSAPLYCTGIGKALLSKMTMDWVDSYIQSAHLHRYTDTTIVTRQELLSEIQSIREQGYAVDNGEHEDDVRCIAVPIWKDEDLYGAISISAPSYRFPNERLLSYAPLIRKSSSAIAEQLFVRA